MSSQSHSYVASLDVGTTTIRCIIFNSSTKIVGYAKTSVKLLYPQPGHVEMDPYELWAQVTEVIKNAIADAKLEAKDIKSLGISTQRATLLTWSRDSGKPFHNFITWKDTRAKQICNELNSSVFLKTVRFGAYGMYLINRSNRFLTGSRLKIASNHVTGRLLWAIRNIPDLQSAIHQNDALFGTIDTWLLYKFTNGKLHVTDISNASATGFYDPFKCEWGSFATKLGVPVQILPTVVDNDYKFGNTSRDIFGVEIPIGCVMADQPSSMFAAGGFQADDIKITLGTGAFVDVNTGNHVHTSSSGIYPVIGWKLNGTVVYIAEAACNDCGSLIEWLLHSGLISSPSEIDGLATSVDSSGGVYFIPAFSGLGPPINDDRAASGFLGIKPNTTRNHLVRAVVEGMVHRTVYAYDTLKRETNKEYERVTVDGGVSNNDFICQLLANLSGLVVERLDSHEKSALGVGFLAGISVGIWQSHDEVRKYAKVEKIFTPKSDERAFEEFDVWVRAVEKFKGWYDDN